MLKSDKSDVKNEILKTSEKFEKKLNEEIEIMRTFVNNTTTQAQAHRENLQEKYNEKLSKIKDVCA